METSMCVVIMLLLVLIVYLISRSSGHCVWNSFNWGRGPPDDGGSHDDGRPDMSIVTIGNGAESTRHVNGDSTTTGTADAFKQEGIGTQDLSNSRIRSGASASGAFPEFCWTVNAFNNRGDGVQRFAGAIIVGERHHNFPPL